VLAFIAEDFLGVLAALGKIFLLRRNELLTNADGR